MSCHVIAASKSKSRREQSSSDAGDFETMDASRRKQKGVGGEVSRVCANV